MKKVITYGTYDLLHQGYINLLRRAKELGDYLIVGVTSDSFDRGRGKLNVRNNVLERVQAVKATGYADEVIIEDYLGQKIDDIQKYDVDIFAIGSDWLGKFDYLNEYCKVVYLPRTEGVSSTVLRKKSQELYRIGIVGTGRIANRFIPESKFVDGIDVTAVYNPHKNSAVKFAAAHGIKAYSEGYGDFLNSIDAVYVASPHLTHYQYTKTALHSGKHVLCEIPFVLSADEAKELFDYAEEHNLVLLEASKTAFCPSFNHIVTLVKSGIVGEVVDIKASLSKIVSTTTREFDASQAGGAMNEHAPLTVMAVIKMLGVDYSELRFYSKIENAVDIYTKVDIYFPHATASITLGIGVKTEGNLVVSGTKGYIYVPAPWWLTDYFEVRYEDQTKNRKYFYSYDGDGLRYEIQEFISMIVNKRGSCYKLKRCESIAIAEILEKYNNREKFNCIIMKRLLVIGGANGIGLSIATEIAEKEDCEIVYIVDRVDVAPENMNSKFKVFLFDLTSEDYSFFNQFKDIDSLMITAGFGELSLFKDVSEHYITMSFAVNCIAPIRIVHHFMNKLQNDRDFYCGIMVSVAGFVSSPFFAVYGATKASLKIFIESVNVELEKNGSYNKILNVSAGSFQGTSFNGGKTDLSLLRPIAAEIIHNLEIKNDLLIFQYEEIFKNVLERYHNDFRAEGRRSFDYKLQSGRVKGSNNCKL